MLKSDLIINSPVALLSDLPVDLKAKITQAFMDAPVKDKAAFQKLSDGKNLRYDPASTADYEKTIEMVKFVDALRKKKS